MAYSWLVLILLILTNINNYNCIIIQSYNDGKLYGQETYIGYIELSSEPLKVLLVTNE